MRALNRATPLSVQESEVSRVQRQCKPLIVDGGAALHENNAIPIALVERYLPPFDHAEAASLCPFETNATIAINMFSLHGS